jgi:hypothetical protein
MTSTAQNIWRKLDVEEGASEEPLPKPFDLALFLDISARC